MNPPKTGRFEHFEKMGGENSEHGMCDHEKWINHSGCVLSNMGDFEELVFLKQNGCFNTRMVAFGKMMFNRQKVVLNKPIIWPWFKILSFIFICLELCCKHKGVAP